MTEQRHFHFPLSCIGEGNGNPLQCSCLENPRDGGAWWAAVYGVAQSRTRLKRLSRGSSRRIIALQYWFHFGHISTGVSLGCTYACSLFTLPPSPTPSHTSRLWQSPALSSLEPYSKFPLATYFTYCVLTHIYGTKEDGTDEPICKAAMEMQTQRTELRTQAEGRKERWWDECRECHGSYTPPYVKGRHFSESELLETDMLLVPVSV